MASNARVRKHSISILVGSLTAVVSAILVLAFTDWLPSQISILFNGASCTDRYVKNRPTIDRHLRILVFGLDGDTEGEQQIYIADALRKTFDVDGIRVGVELVRTSDGEGCTATSIIGDLSSSIRRGDELVRLFMTQHGGDIAIWGRVFDSANKLDLRLIPANTAIPVGAALLIDRGIVLQTSFDTSVAQLLAAKVLIDSDLSAKRVGEWNERIYRRKIETIRAILDNKNIQLSESERISLKISAIRVAINLYSMQFHLDGSTSLLRDIAELEQEASGASSVIKAKVLSAYGYLNLIMGQRQGKIELLKSALEYSEKARLLLQSDSQSEDPFVKIRIENHIALIAAQLADFSSDAQLMKQAGELSRSALVKVDKIKNPIEYAVLLSNYAMISARLMRYNWQGADIERSLTLMNEAKEIFRSNELTNYIWNVQNSICMGTMLSLGLQTQVEEYAPAFEACEEALDLAVITGTKYSWLLSVNNLGRVHLNAGIWARNLAQLDEAVARFEEIIDKTEIDESRDIWVSAWINLATAHRYRGLYKPSVSDSRRALSMFQHALMLTTDNSENIAAIREGILSTSQDIINHKQ